PVAQHRPRHPGLDHGLRLGTLPGRPGRRAHPGDRQRGLGHLALRPPLAAAQGPALMRPSRATIDLDALRHNHRHARALGGGRALAVVKADAYGHGAVACARALEPEADGFGVACIEEALELREAGIRAPILLLEGFFEADELALIDQHDLWCVVQAVWQIDAIERARPARPLTVWLKLDTGMHRLGLGPQEYRECLHRLQALPQVREVVAMTHFSRADELDSARTEEQLATFHRVIAGQGAGGTELVASVANSPALLGWPATRAQFARPGLML